MTPQYVITLPPSIMISLTWIYTTWGCSPTSFSLFGQMDFGKKAFTDFFYSFLSKKETSILSPYLTFVDHEFLQSWIYLSIIMVFFHKFHHSWVKVFEKILEYYQYLFNTYKISSFSFFLPSIRATRCIIEQT